MTRPTFQSRFISNELIQNAKSSGFSFTCYKENVDWEKLAKVDLDRAVRDVDIPTLQEHITTVLRCDLGQLRGVDPGLIKLLRIAQLSLEYCIFCQEQLTNSLITLETTHDATLKELDHLQQENKIITEELKKEVKKKKKLIQQKENLNNAIFQCTKCSKVFMNLAFLESHIKRRHAPLQEDTMVQKGDSTLLEQLNLYKEELNKEREGNKIIAQANKEAQLAREEELWAQVEKKQAEQRLRHQAEITELAASFQTQLRNSFSAENWVPNNTRAIEMQYQEQLSVLQLQLENKKETELLKIKAEMDASWQKRLDTTESWHKAEMEKLLAQIEAFKTEEQSRWSKFSAQQEALLAMQISQSSARTAETPTTPTPMMPSDDPILSIQLSQPANDSATIYKKTPSQRTDTPPLPVPRRRLQSADTPKSTQSASTSNNSSSFIFPEIPKPSTSKNSQRNSKSYKTPPVSTSLTSESPITKAIKKVEKPQSSSSETSEEPELEEALQEIEEMKSALRKNPDILNSLRTAVESHVTVRLAEFGIESNMEGLESQEHNRISELLTHQRKISKKANKNWSHIRGHVDRLVRNKMSERGLTDDTSSPQSVAGPSSKDSSQKGFLARLAHHYRHKRKKAAKPQVHTSTPFRKLSTSALDASPSTTERKGETPHSILKTSRERLWSSNKDISSVRELSNQPRELNLSRSVPLERTQSISGSKSVTFATKEHAELSSSSSSESKWDEPEDLLQETEDLQLSQPKVSKELNIMAAGDASIPSAASRTRPKSAASSTTSFPDSRQLAFDDSNPSTSSEAILNKAKSKKQKSTDAESDNSWDLEDI